jgi:hypothetical protein
MIDAKTAADYLKHYIEAYRLEYRKLTNAPPEGLGYPSLKISPYLYSKKLFCHLTIDGAVIIDLSWEPPNWENTGTRFVRTNFVVPPFPDVVDHADGIADGETNIQVFKYDINLNYLLVCLTFGTFTGPAHVEPVFWQTGIIKDIGFVYQANRKHNKFYHYMEISWHVESAAWDKRSIWARVQVDVKRDYENAVAYGRDAFRGPRYSPGILNDRLSNLKNSIDTFQVLLERHSEAYEHVFHEFLRDNHLLLDVYGTPISKPKFYYHEGEAPLGKSYVEPDFIIKYPLNEYKLVELEQPSKRIATSKGHPRAELTQAAFQIAEWKDYIRKYFNKLADEYPGIDVNCTSMVVISRSREKEFGSKFEIRRHLEMLKQTYAVDEIYSYDDLLTRANAAYTQLSGLNS